MNRIRSPTIRQSKVNSTNKAIGKVIDPVAFLFHEKEN